MSYIKTPKPTPTPTNGGLFLKIRKFLYVTLEYPDFTQQARTVQHFIISTVLLSIATTITLSLLQQKITKWIDLIVGIIFALEFLIRISCFTVYGEPLAHYFKNPYFLVDCFSCIPFILEVVIRHEKLVFIQLFRVVPIFKISRYLVGLEVVFKGVKSSIHQFWTILVALLITIFGFGITLYYSEMKYSNENDYDSTNIYSGTESMWMVIVTLTTTGYGDKTPKTPQGRIIASVLAFIGNSIILALPTAIIGFDFSKAYNEDQEQKKQEELNVKYLVLGGDQGENLKQLQLKYMYRRLSEIENRNTKLSHLLEQSNQVTRELTVQMETLLLKMGDEDGMQELAMLVKNRQIRDQRRPGQMGTKIRVFDKFLKANKKIKISNLLKNIKKNTTVNTNTLKSKRRSPKKKKTVKEVFIKTTKNLITQQNIIKILKEMKLSQEIIQVPKRKEARFNSVGNENLILRKRNEELGHLAFEFMNDIDSSLMSSSDSSGQSSPKSNSEFMGDINEKQSSDDLFSNHRRQENNLLVSSALQSCEITDKAIKQSMLRESLRNLDRFKERKLGGFTQKLIPSKKEIICDYQRNRIPSFQSKSNQISNL